MTRRLRLRVEVPARLPNPLRVTALPARADRSAVRAEARVPAVVQASRAPRAAVEHLQPAAARRAQAAVRRALEPAPLAAAALEWLVRLRAAEHPEELPEAASPTGP